MSSGDFVGKSDLPRENMELEENKPEVPFEDQPMEIEKEGGVSSKNLDDKIRTCPVDDEPKPEVKAENSETGVGTLETNVPNSATPADDEQEKLKKLRRMERNLARRNAQRDNRALCLFCDKVLDLDSSASLQTGLTPYQCKSCEEHFGDRRNRLKHKNKVEEEKVEGDQSTSAKNPGKPEKVKENVDTDSSSEKPEVNPVPKEKLRSKVAHLTESGPYNCKFCTEKFKTPKALAFHKKSSHADQVKLYRCSECSKVFINQSNLARHQKGSHQQAEASSSSHPTQSGKQDSGENNVKVSLKTEMSLEQIMEWQKRKQEEYEEDNRQYQKKLTNFIWNMNKHDKGS